MNGGGAQIFSPQHEMILHESLAFCMFYEQRKDSIFLDCPFKVVAKQIALEDRDGVSFWKTRQFYLFCSLIR